MSATGTRNYCPDCAHELEGKTSERSIGYCPRCKARVVVRMAKQKPNLTAPLLAHQRISMLEAEIKKLRAQIADLQKARD